LNEDGLVRIPQHLSFQEASTLPCAAVTAWNALAAGRLRPGATILIQGTGGVAIFALQLARLHGLRVLGISSSDDKLQRASSLGLDAGLNYTENPDWDRWALEETSGEGVDLVVEVGGIATMPTSIKAIRIGGTIAQIGILSGPADLAANIPFPIPSILHKQARIQGIYVGSRKDFEEMNKAIVLTQLRPIGENFHWSQAREALTRMEESSHFGKLVLTIA
jgi:NADPH:quinone reductase-like Zn-dependent oxidoreductase